MRLVKFIRDFMIVSSYLTGFYRLYFRKEPYSIRVIAFHKINNRALFERKVLFLINNFNIISLDNIQDGKICKERINVAITFDDCYKNWMSNAVPVLKKYNIPATFFICSGMVGLDREGCKNFIYDKMNIDPVECLSEVDIKQLVKEGFCIGGHTKSHVDLGGKFEYSDVIEDKKYLEKFGQVKYFAFPYGRKHNISSKGIELLKNIGYTGVFTIIPGFNTKRFIMHRDSLDVRQPDIVWKAWLNGAYDVRA